MLTPLRAGNNSLDYLPPEIAHLQALKDLDVVNNNLRFLPAEMTTMTLTNLNVHTNPWYPDPANPAAPPDASETVGGATRVHFHVPPLREVVLRYLLTPSANQQRVLAPSPPTSPTTMMTTARALQPTTLEDRFQLPLEEGALTPADAALLARLAPAAVSAPRRHAFFSRATTSAPSAGLFSTTLSPKSDSARRGAEDQKCCSGRCPSPRHIYGTPQAVVAQAWPSLGPPFVMPAEERYTWVGELAGVRVGESTGGVPILWRGCGRGCLDFLDKGNTGTAVPIGEPKEDESGVPPQA